MKTWNPIDTVPKDDTEVILWDGDDVITWGKFDINEDCLLYSWFGADGLEKDTRESFKYWIPMPRKDKTK